MIELLIFKPLYTTRNERLLRIGREFSCVVAGQSIGMVGSVIGVRILTGVLPPNIYGELALAMTIAMLVNQMVMGPVAQSALRFFPAAGEAAELNSFFKVLKHIVFVSSFVLILIFLFIDGGLWLGGYDNWLALTFAAGVYALIWGWNTLLNGIQNAARHRAIVAWHQAASTWSRFFLAWSLVVLFSASSTFAMFGYFAGTVLVFISQLWFFRTRFGTWSRVSKAGDRDTALRWRSSMLHYAWPFACWGAITWFQMASSRWALQIYRTTADVGLYSVLYQLGYAPLMAFTGMLVQFAAPIFFERAGGGTDLKRMRHVYFLNWRLTKFMLLGTLVLFLIACFFQKTIFNILVAPAYHSASGLLAFVILSSSVFAVAQFALISILSENESRTLIYPKVVTAIVGGGLNFLGAAWYGVPGVVAAGLAYSVLYLGWILSLVRFRMKKFSTRPQEEKTA